MCLDEPPQSLASLETGGSLRRTFAEDWLHGVEDISELDESIRPVALTEYTSLVDNSGSGNVRVVAETALVLNVECPGQF